MEKLPICPPLSNPVASLLKQHHSTIKYKKLCMAMVLREMATRCLSAHYLANTGVAVAGFLEAIYVYFF